VRQVQVSRELSTIKMNYIFRRNNFKFQILFLNKLLYVIHNYTTKHMIFFVYILHEARANRITKMIGLIEKCHNVGANHRIKGRRLFLFLTNKRLFCMSPIKL